MNFDYSLKERYVKKIPVNTLRAKSLIRSSKDAIETAKDIPLQDGKLKSIFREIYEGLREYCEAIGYVRGYKFLSHEAITYFLAEIINERGIAKKFDRYRKIRNGVNYYADFLAKETVEEALEEIPRLIKQLAKYVGNIL